MHPWPRNCKLVHVQNGAARSRLTEGWIFEQGSGELIPTVRQGTAKTKLWMLSQCRPAGEQTGPPFTTTYRAYASCIHVTHHAALARQSQQTTLQLTSSFKSSCDCFRGWCAAEESSSLSKHELQRKHTFESTSHEQRYVVAAWPSIPKHQDEFIMTVSLHGQHPQKANHHQC